MRLAGWKLIGELTFTPDDADRVVGTFDLGEDHDTIWVRVTSKTAPTPWPWSYGILGWRSAEGYELGSVKAYSEQVGEVFRLGVGLPPMERTGSITFEPRSFNFAWVKQGNPWTLQFEAQSGISTTPPSFPDFGTRATLGVLGDLVNAGVSYVIRDGVARILLSPVP
jgi:hypothetical protein